MPDGKQSDLTPEERIALQLELLLAKLAQSYAPSQPTPRSRWVEVLNSTVLATLITVLIGGIFGQLMLSEYQERQKRSELIQEQFRQYIQRQQEVIQQALDLVGAAEFDAGVLQQLEQRRSDPNEITDPQERRIISGQRVTLLEGHIDVIKKWNTGRRQMSLLLTYYNYGRPDIKSAWESTEASTTELLNCAQASFDGYLSHHRPLEESCNEKEASLNNSLAQLSKALDQSRQYSWQTPPTPNK